MGAALMQNWGQISALILALGAIALIGVYTVVAGVPPTPPGRRLRQTLGSLLPERDAVSGVVYDLGSGWGGLAIRLARRYPGHAVRGVELSPLPWLISYGRAMMARAPGLSFQRGDFFKMSLDDAGLVVCYLFPAKMVRLEEKLARELAPGTPVLSLVFAFPTWTPTRILDAGDLYHSKVYLYRVP